MDRNQNLTEKGWKHQVVVLFTAAMLGVSNSWNNETKLLSDFDKKPRIVEVETVKPDGIIHPNLLWKPQFYIKKLFNDLRYWN